ncbi:general secretion pathway protein M [marine gamma proteobacterium HTCC2148]|jgi:general secretion pathway protein M|nr:general secretion pathway protein M [marine gamma proteobacterium HTCC2148]MBT5006392.1 type II secretion system protein M [Halieaceae bacterium]MBT6126581.1 type II secretion system protein M [Halieaceae bacterium]MBT7719886.1 type II secretion system protein M [Halieaceae bacterium]
MKQWFTGLTQREQLSLLIMGLAVALYLAFVIVIAPLSQARDRMVVQNRGVAESLQRVEVLVSQILHLRETGNGSSTNRNLASLVNRSTSSYQLQVNRLQPNSRGELQVRLENAVFDDLIAWLYQVEYKEGLRVLETSITQAGTVGRVNATVRLAQG